MSGVRALRRIQIGTESTGTPGTAVAATACLRMVGTLEDLREVVFPPEDVGLLSGTDRMYVPKYLAGITTEGGITFEQVGYIFQAGMAETTATTDTGTGTGYIYTFPLATSAQRVPQTYTIEGGDDQEAEEMAYSFVKEFTLSGNAGENWNVSANWSGRTCSTTTFTASTDAPLPTVTEALFSQTRLYIDDDTGTMGTTVKSNTLLSAELKVATGFQEVFTADGELYFTFVKQVPPEVTLTITFEHDGTSTAEKTAWRAGTARLIRLNCLGPALTAAGAHTYKTLQINLAGRWEKFEKLDEMDGNDVVKGVFRARYNSTSATFGSIVLVNELSVLP